MTRNALPLLFFVLFLVPHAPAQTSASPMIIGPAPALLPPDIDGSGRVVVWASSIGADGAPLNILDVFSASPDGSALRRLTRLQAENAIPQGAFSLALSADASRAAFTALVPRNSMFSEEVHVLDMGTGADRVVSTDIEGCILPLATFPECPACFFTCLHSAHITHDGSRVLYAVRRQKPFYVVNADGSGRLNLPVFFGDLAASAQRVISRTGRVVFTSSAPHGPTFAPSPTDVYLMDLDGTNITNVTRFGNDPALFARNATISADGGTIVFESNLDPDTRRPNTQLTHIWTIRSDGTGLRNLTANVVCLALTCPVPGGSSPSISGDGTLVSFVNGKRIVLMAANGSFFRILASFRESAAADPVISDDGSRVAFTIGPRSGGRGAIYSVRTDATDLQRVFAPRVINSGGVTGIADGGFPSPGSLLSAYGLNLTDTDAVTVATSFPLPQALAGVSLLVNGAPVPLVAVTPWQVNAQLPLDIPPGPTFFQFGGTGWGMTGETRALAPATFTLASGTTQQAAVFHAGTRTPADRANPAVAGEMLEIYGTGLGPTIPSVATGMPAPVSPLARTANIPEVLIGSTPAQVVFSGLVPGLAGVYQVNAIVPSGLPVGQHVVRFRVGGTTSSGFGTISVR